MAPWCFSKHRCYRWGVLVTRFYEYVVSAYAVLGVRPNESARIEGCHGLNKSCGLTEPASRILNINAYLPVAGNYVARCSAASRASSLTLMLRTLDPTCAPCFGEGRRRRGDGVQLRTKGFNHDIKNSLTIKKGLT